MKLYKYKDLFSLLATVGWLSFVFAAFKGFNFWYLGFVFFFWLALGILNYRHESSLWLLKNRWSRFLKYYLVLIILGFLADFLIGQVLAGSWVYPPYDSIDDWSRLYFLIYPLGGLSVVELIYFLASVFKEKVVLIHEDVKNLFVTKLEFLMDLLLVLFIMVLLMLKEVFQIDYIQIVFIFLFSIWMVLATIKLRYYIRHFTYWVAILVATALLSIFLYEIPNTAVYEWKYYFPVLFPEYSILGLQVWLVWGWYFLVLVILKYWISVVLLNHRK